MRKPFVRLVLCMAVMPVFPAVSSAQPTVKSNVRFTVPDIASDTAEADYRWPIPLGRNGELEMSGIAGAGYDGRYGLEQYKAGSYSEALPYLQRAAKQGDANAMALLGRMYGSGLGTDKNRQVAMNMFTRALQNGNMLAHCYLGEMLMKEGKSRQGMEEFAKAADRDFVYGLYLLAGHHWAGNGCERDYAKAVGYMERMAELGVRIKGILGMIYATGMGVRADYGKAFAYLTDEGYKYTDSELMELAKLYYYGRGTGEQVKHQKNGKYKVWFYKEGETGRASITDALIVLDGLVANGYEGAAEMRSVVNAEYEERNIAYNKTTAPQFGTAVKRYIQGFKEPQRPAIASAGQGQIIIRAKVSASGYVSGAQMKARVLQRLDEAALALVNGMPKWEPGTRGGSPADMGVDIGISFFPLRVSLLRYWPTN